MPMASLYGALALLWDRKLNISSSTFLRWAYTAQAPAPAEMRNGAAFWNVREVKDWASRGLDELARVNDSAAFELECDRFGSVIEQHAQQLMSMDQWAEEDTRLMGSIESGVPEGEPFHSSWNGLNTILQTQPMADQLEGYGAIAMHPLNWVLTCEHMSGKLFFWVHGPDIVGQVLPVGTVPSDVVFDNLRNWLIPLEGARNVRNSIGVIFEEFKLQKATDWAALR